MVGKKEFYRRGSFQKTSEIQTIGTGGGEFSVDRESIRQGNLAGWGGVNIVGGLRLGPSGGGMA